MRADVPTPAISVNSEARAGFLPPVSTSKFTRVWEVAGTSHASFYAVNYVDVQWLHDQSVPGPNGPQTFTQLMNQQGCKLSPLFSKVDTGLVLSAALDSVQHWAETGKPAAPTIQFRRDEKGGVLRDAQGQVMGACGWRNSRYPHRPRPATATGWLACWPATTATSPQTNSSNAMAVCGSMRSRSAR